MIIKCSECEKEISDKAKFCVNCGCPIEDKYKQADEYTSEQTDRPEATTLKTVATIILVSFKCNINAIFFYVGIETIKRSERHCLI